MNLFPYNTEDLENFKISGKFWSQYISDLLQLGIEVKEGFWLGSKDQETLINSSVSITLMRTGVKVAWIKKLDSEAELEFNCQDSICIQYIWDLLRVNEQVVGSFQDSNLLGRVHSSAVLDGKVHLGKGSRILPGVYIEGNAIIGEGCKIGPNCYIRGNTSVGNRCHIGQSVEVKNSMLGDDTKVGHLSYIGDSILGHGVNVGAGTITSNFRHDGKNHRSEIDGELIDTGRRKFGVVLADGVHTGINTTFYPGRKLGKNVTTLPNEVIKKDK